MSAGWLFAVAILQSVLAMAWRIQDALCCTGAFGWSEVTVGTVLTIWWLAALRARLWNV